MENSNNYLIRVYEDIGKISNEILILKEKYTNFFSIDFIFSNENGGKTRLNRQLYSENHEDIQTSILQINLYLEESLGILKDELKILLAKYNQLENLDLSDFLLDDKNFIEIINIDLAKQVVSKEMKSRYISDIQNIIKYKNKLMNLKYYMDMADTSIFDKHINKLGVEDLINSALIFELIDSYALQYEELKKFEREVLKFKDKTENMYSLNEIEPLLELHKRRVDGYFYADVRYKITLDYETKLDSGKLKKINMSFIENIISRLIEQSSMDIIKKELKKGKIQKQILVQVGINKNNLTIAVTNNGFEISDIYNLFLLNSENKEILEVKNLVNSLNASLDIEPIENEGMKYTVVVSLKNI